MSYKSKTPRNKSKTPRQTRNNSKTPRVRKKSNATSTPNKTPKKKGIIFTFDDEKETQSSTKLLKSKKGHKKSKTNGIISDGSIKPSSARRTSKNSIKNKKKQSMKKRSKSNGLALIKTNNESKDSNDTSNDGNNNEQLMEIDLLDDTKKDELKGVFKEFHDNLKKQQKLLMKKFDRERVRVSQLMGMTEDLKKSLKSHEPNAPSLTLPNMNGILNDSTPNTPLTPSFKKNMLYIDNKGVNKYISKIGLIKGKKYEELEKEQNMAINKLKQILQYEEQIANEHSKAIKLKKECEREYEICEIKKKKVEQELESVKPLIEQAKLAVSNIKKSAMDELRSLRKPPSVVQMVMECAIYLVRSEMKKNWMDTKKLVSFKFVKQVLAFDTMELVEHKGKEKVKTIQYKWFSDPEFTYDRAIKASKVAGPLVTWIQSQIKYADVLVKVKPLIDEIKELERKLRFSESEVRRAELLDIELTKKIKICRGEMLEMVGYRKIGNRYYK